MYKTLLNLEKDFFRLKKITNKEWLTSILHDNFTEIGKSGTLSTKKNTIDYLSSLKSKRNIIIYNFECEELKKDCWIVHYITRINNTLFYRTSVWIRENNLKLFFHQASELKTHISLKQC